MASTARFAEVAALAGDPARASILLALADGRALPAAELAKAAGVTAQTTSGHLRRMSDAGLLRAENKGRRRLYRFAGHSVACLVECILRVAAEIDFDPKGRIHGPRDEAIVRARTCHDHLAGRLGVALTDALAAEGRIEIGDDGGVLTQSGVAFLADIGVEGARLPTLKTRPSGGVFCRPCLDWSERRPHLAGTVGAMICAHSFERGWIRRQPGTRAVAITPIGERIYRECFRADWRC